MLKPKVGDLVRAKPSEVLKVFNHDGGFVECYGGTIVAFDEIEEILPRPVAVGDTVKIKAMVGSPARFTILAIHEGEAWMQQITSVTSGHSTYRLEAIEHAED